MKKCLLIPLFALLLTACGGGTTTVRTDTPQPSTTLTPSVVEVTPPSTTIPPSTTTIKRSTPRPIPTTQPPFQTTSADAAGFRTPLGDCTTTDIYTAERYSLTYDPTCPVVK